MIVPKFRLLFWVGAVVLPFGTLITVVPSAAFVPAVLIAILFVLAITDAAFALGRLKGIRVELPQVVRLSKDREGKIELRIHNETMKIRQVRVGLAFPEGIYSPQWEMTADLPKESQSSSFKWSCKSLKQGRYVLDKYYLEAASHLGFWAARTSGPANTEIRVYPNVFGERKHLSALFLNRGMGIHTQRQIGKGRDFEQLREYIPGDSYEDIHWKATAKRGHPITKVYQIERTQEIYIIIDASRLSARDSRPEGRTSESEQSESSFTTILDRFVTASLVVGLAAERQGDMFGILAFNDRIRSFVKAKNGKAHYSACRDMLYTLYPRRVAPDFSELFTFIATRIRRRSLLIFLVNLDDPLLSESFVRDIDLVRRRHLVLVNMPKPEKANPLFSSPAVQSVEDIYRHMGGHFLWQSLRETEKVLKRHGMGFSLLDNEKMSAQLISQYLSIKQRQSL